MEPDVAELTNPFQLYCCRCVDCDDCHFEPRVGVCAQREPDGMEIFGDLGFGYVLLDVGHYLPCTITSVGSPKKIGLEARKEVGLVPFF